MIIERPKISIITVVFNNKSGIEKTIESVINQNFKLFEFIIIDNLSTDGTSELIQSYIDHVKVHVREKDAGIWDAFNKGIKYADGDWIYFLNAEDCLINNKILSKIYYSNLAITECDIVTGKVRIIDQLNNFQGYYHPNKPSVLLDLKKGNVIAHQATFINKTVFNKIGFFKNYKIHMDYDLWVRGWKEGITFEFIDEIIADFSREGVSSNRKNYLLALREQLSILKYNNFISRYDYHRRYIYNAILFNIKSTIRMVLGKKISEYISLINNRLS